MRRPFTLYKENTKSGIVWYARFWDETARKYKHSRSTGVLVEGKKERRYEAEEAARKLYAELAPINFCKSNSANKTVTQNPVIAIPEIQTLAIPTIQIPQINTPNQTQYTTVGNTPLIQYLKNFWTPNSEYANFKKDVEKKPLSQDYIEMNYDDIKRHIEPFPGFNGVTVGTLNKAILKKYLIWLAGRKTQRRKKDGTIIEGNTLSSRRANSILQSVRVAVRWAFDNEDILIDPFHKLGEVTESIKEKGVLNFDERNTLIAKPITDYRKRLIMLLGCLCGLRRGEIRGLKWGDIENDIIHVQHNYQDKEGLKKPKYNSIRKVPIPTAVQNLLDIAKEKDFDTSLDSYILKSPKFKGRPVSNNFFRAGVTSELLLLGISKEQAKERVLTCHSMRHTFVTLAQLSGIPEVIVSALAGHKSVYTTKKYSHVPQVINFDEARSKIDNSYINKKVA